MRAQESGLFHKVRNNGALVPDVISGREAVNPCMDHIVGNLRCDAESGGRILNIGNAKIDAIFVDQALELFLNQPSARFAEDVAEEENSHYSQL